MCRRSQPIDRSHQWCAGPVLEKEHKSIFNTLIPFILVVLSQVLTLYNNVEQNLTIVK